MLTEKEELRFIQMLTGAFDVAEIAELTDLIIKDRQLSIDQEVKKKLTEYTEFLVNEGYCDIDVYTEPPTAIDKFLNPELR
jgi:hypothetical protein